MKKATKFKILEINLTLKNQGPWNLTLYYKKYTIKHEKKNSIILDGEI